MVRSFERVGCLGWPAQVGAVSGKVARPMDSGALVPPGLIPFQAIGGPRAPKAAWWSD